MQNKGAVRLFAILLAITCVYYLTFTFVSRGVEKDAREYAADYVNRSDVKAQAEKWAAGNAQQAQFYQDSLALIKEDDYLDSVKRKTVYNIGITSFTYEDVKEKEINLGLDLRGGMNVILEVSVPDIIKALSNNSNDPVFNQALSVAQEQSRKSNKDFVTLFGEAFQRLNPNAKLAANFQTIELKGKIDFNTSNDEVLKFIKERVDEAINTAETTLRARIDKFGVTQPNIQKLEGSGRILVELPGVSDKQRVRKLLQGTANLEFWETYENNEIYPLLVEANKRAKEILSPASSDSLAKADSSKQINNPASASNNATDTVKQSASLQQQLSKSDTAGTNELAASDTSAERIKRENPLFAILKAAIYKDQQGNYNYSPGPVVGYANIEDTAQVNELLNNKKIRSLFPPRIKFLWTLKPFDEAGTALQLVAIKVTSRDGKAPLSGDIITDARKQFDERGAGSPQISMSMTSDAAQTWKRLTKDNIGKSIAIVLDNSVYSFPTVQSEIAGGQSSITGNFTVKEADDLINVLKAGKLPAPARIVEETVVGPTLGQEAIKDGVLSFVIALIVVLLFMAFYYSKAGWVADLALFANVFFIMGVLASLGAVLTLPGIAGIVLTIGLSVDANILIFERVREELRLGKGIGLAVKDGYRGALSSILDSNITTLLLGIILYVFGTGPIQGFATTLIIGILCSLFCAIFITRLIFDALLSKNKVISFSTKLTENAFKNIKINFVGNRKYYYIFSGLIIALGIVFYVKNGGFNLGIDFKGGRSYVVRFDQEHPTEEVRNALEESFGGAGLEVKQFGERTQQKITTTYLIEDNSEDAELQVEAKLNEGLSKLGSQFDIMSSQKVGETISKDIRSKAIGAILFSCLVMFVYIRIRFKKWQYGMGSVVALLHDVLVILSFYAIFDGILPFALEIDQHFIAAILTVMGYSMTDTVVVFDRIREYLTERNKKELDKEEKHRVINESLNNTLSRTINTSAITFFVLLSIFIFGGDVIRGFAFALLIGIVIGTYSSLCIATPVVIDFDRDKEQMPELSRKERERAEIKA